MFSNIGLVYRQRAQLMPWLLIFGAAGLELRRKRKLAARRPRAEMTARSGAPAGAGQLAPGAHA
ncbi:MAG: hypothetical protein HYX76_11855 [Acidobacteria bacterium]|nr:hypothetical protein [Acidobacteriota bacterium]